MAKKKFYEIEGAKIVDTSAEGKGVYKREEGKVIFVENAIEGDVVKIQSKKSRKGFEKAKIISFEQKSDHRAEPHCEHYENCGGCKMQHAVYDYQLEWKQRTVQNAMERIGGFKELNFKPIIGCDQTEEYRNKLDYAASNKRWLSYEELDSGEKFDDRSGVGFHLAGMFDKVLDIDKCHHMPQFQNEIRNFIKKRSRELEIPFFDIRNNEGSLRNIIIRNNVKDEWMVCVIFHEVGEKEMTLVAELGSKYDKIKSLQYAENQKKNDSYYDLDFKVHKGEDHIYEYLHEKKFKITPKSFFQTNTQQCIKLYDVVKNLADLKENQTVYDLYCGVGSIGIYVYEKGINLVGVDSVPEAIQDAEYNAKINKIENAKYYASEMKNIFNNEFIEKNGSPDVIIVDPPRAGIHKEVINQLNSSGCPKIVYVSCNPQTMANDLKVLNEQYDILEVQPVDMFPHTVHVEQVAILKKN